MEGLQEEQSFPQAFDFEKLLEEQQDNPEEQADQEFSLVSRAHSQPSQLQVPKFLPGSRSMSPMKRNRKPCLSINLPPPEMETIQESTSMSCGTSNDVITKVTEHVFLSGYKAACNKENLKNNNITHVINTVAHKHISPFPTEFIYHEFQLKDDGSSSVILAIEKSLRIIEEVKQVNGRVLVHCEHGCSRSATMVASYLMLIEGSTESEAVTFLQTVRPQVDPNISMIVQLQQIRNPVGKVFAITGKGEVSLSTMDEVQNAGLAGVVICSSEKILI